MIQAYFHFQLINIIERILTYYLSCLKYCDLEMIIVYMYLYAFHLFYQDWCLRWCKNDTEYVPKKLRHRRWKIVTALSNYITNSVDIYAKRIGIGSSNRSSIRRQRKIARAVSRIRTASRGKQSYAYRSRNLLVAMSALAYPATAGAAIKPIKTLTFDSDQSPIGIDNRCSACISNCIHDFDGPLVETSRAIKGIGGAKITPVMKGTIKWSWLDDEGKPHKFTIPNSFYVPKCGARLLSPQHWAQSQKDKSGTGCTTDGNGVTLFWNQK